MARTGIYWAPPPSFLVARLAKLASGLQREAGKTLSEQARQLEAQMKAQAPWSDITGATRSNLFSQATPNGIGGEVVVSMGGPFGPDPYLEIRSTISARRPIIRPTMAYAGGQVLESFDGLIDRAL